MKQRFLFTVGTILTGLLSAFAQNSSSLDFEVTTQSREIPTFHSIEVIGRFKIIVSPIENANLSITAPNKLLDAVETTVKNGILHINMPNAVKSIDANILKHLKMQFNDYLIRQPIEIHIGAGKLQNITAKGASRIETLATLETSDLQLNFSGAAKGELKINVGNHLTVSLVEAARLEMEGSAEKAIVSANGAATFYGEKMPIKDAQLILNGASRAEMHITKNADIELNGATKAVCIGNPRIVKQQVSRGSSITMK